MAPLLPGLNYFPSGAKAPDIATSTARLKPYPDTNLVPLLVDLTSAALKPLRLRTLTPALKRWATPGLLHSAAFWWAAAVVRDRCGIANVFPVDACRCQRADCRLASRSWPAHTDLDRAHTMIASLAGGVDCRLLRRERCPFTRPAEAQRTGTLPREHIARRIADGHDRIVERCLDVRDCERHILALFLLERFLLALFLGRCSCCCRWFRHKLCLRRCFLLVRYRALARTFTRAGIGVRPLTAHRKIPAMTVSAVRADLDEPFDVHRDFFAQIALNAAFALHDLANAVDLFFVQVLNFLRAFNARRFQDAPRGRHADPIDMGQCDVRMLLARKIDACNTCHIQPLLRGRPGAASRGVSPGVVCVSNSRKSPAPRRGV